MTDNPLAHISTANVKPDLIAEILRVADTLQRRTEVNVIETMTTTVTGTTVPKEQLNNLEVPILQKLLEALEKADEQHIAVGRASARRKPSQVQ